MLARSGGHESEVKDLGGWRVCALVTIKLSLFMTSQQWWMAGGVAAVIVLVGGYWYLDHAYATELVTNDNAVLIQDQPPGDETVVTYAKLAKPGYVVVYAKDSGGATTVVGQSDLLPAGEHRNVHVKHHTGSHVSSGTTVTAAVVADDGDGVFSPAEDTEVLAGDDADSSAELSDDAVLDENQSDADVAALLDDAGYDLSDEAQADVANGEVTPSDDADDAQGASDAQSDANPLMIDAGATPSEEMDESSPADEATSSDATENGDAAIDAEQ